MGYNSFESPAECGVWELGNRMCFLKWRCQQISEWLISGRVPRVFKKQFWPLRYVFVFIFHFSFLILNKFMLMNQPHSTPFSHNRRTVLLPLQQSALHPSPNPNEHSCMDPSLSSEAPRWESPRPLSDQVFSSNPFPQSLLSLIPYP